jgi:hypothetical protein
MSLNPEEMRKAKRAHDAKQLAKKFLTSQATFHATAAKAHDTSAGDFEKDSSEHIHHSAMAAAHTQAGEDCVECCNECMKADSIFDLFKADTVEDAIIPTQVSGVIPDAQLSPSGNLRAVYRVGMNPIPAANRTDARFDFSKLTSIEE